MFCLKTGVLVLRLSCNGILEVDEKLVFLTQQALEVYEQLVFLKQASDGQEAFLKAHDKELVWRIVWKLQGERWRVRKQWFYSIFMSSSLD